MIPTQLKIIQGSRLNDYDKSEQFIPKNDIKTTKIPSILSKNGKKIWKNTIDLIPENMIKELDLNELMRFVVSVELFNDCYVEVQKEGMVIVNGKGEKVINPFLIILNKQSDIINSSGSNLGLSPASRSKLKLDNGNTKPKNNKFKNLENRL